ncbi:MAG: hypothetical protein JWO25_1449 [Alphaproteobacteria bacterium]|nr:hypothetical protein [Alphaproteobacteria bacterium]
MCSVEKLISSSHLTRVASPRLGHAEENWAQGKAAPNEIRASAGSDYFKRYKGVSG